MQVVCTGVRWAAELRCCRYWDEGLQDWSTVGVSVLVTSDSRRTGSSVNSSVQDLLCLANI